MGALGEDGEGQRSRFRHQLHAAFRRLYRDQRRVSGDFLQRGAITAVPIRSGERMHIGYVMPRGLTLDAIGEAFVAAMKLYAKVEG